MQTNTNSTPAPPVIAVALISAGALSYEILLTRLLANIHWHHLVTMVISLALLGYGTSGTFLTLLQHRLKNHFTLVFTTNALLFAFGSIGVFLLAQQIPLNPLEMAWDRRQLLYLPGLYLLLAVPFFGAANCIGLALWHFHSQSSRLYGFDLLGAGISALAVVGILTLLPATQALLISALLGVIAGGMVLPGQKQWLKSAYWLGSFALLAVPLLMPQLLKLKPADYKDLSKTLTVMGAEIIDRRSGPLGEITLVRNQEIPFRHAPGMSLASMALPPEQLALYVDGNAAGVINRVTAKQAPTYLENLTSSLPHLLTNNWKVLVLGSGGGTNILQALHFNAQKIDAVESNPQLIKLLQHKYGSYSGNIYNRNEVTVHTTEARAFISGSDNQYDLITLNATDSFAGAATGLGAQNESYLYTRQAIDDYLGHLQPNGILSFTRWLRLPPRDSLKLAATIISVLQKRGIKEPGNHIAMIRGWKTFNLMIKKDGFKTDDITAIRNFSRKHSFDLVYFPGIKKSEINRYNRLNSPQLYLGINVLLGPTAKRFIDNYKFDIQPVSDDRPYFFNFSKWETLPELLQLPSQGGLAQLDLGYWIQVTTLAQAIIAAIVLILLPLLFLKRENNVHPAALRNRTLLYFGLLGFAFMFLEIAFIQKFTLLLGHPIYAISTALAGFLVFAGIGSLRTKQFNIEKSRLLLWITSAIGAIAFIYLLLLPNLFEPMQQLPQWGKVIICLLLIAPPAFLMGMPFPIGLTSLGNKASGLTPWAWGINGCASVIGAILASLLAVEIGFSGLVLSAIGGYLLAALVPP